MNETRKFVDFSVGLRYQDLPAEVVEQAKLCVLDITGVSLYGGAQPWGEAVANFVKASGSKPEATVFGKGWKTSAQYAALVNGTGAHGIEMDDRSAVLETHCGASVVPGAIAAAEKAHANGKQLIVGVVLGYELAYRLSRVLWGLPRRHFYGSAIKSLPGVTVAAAKVLGLDAPAMLNALGICGSMASGIREWSDDPVGTMVKRFQGGGWPSHNGVSAALLAANGLTGPATVLEGENGLCHSFALKIIPKMEEITKGLGKSFQIMEREIKPYAAWGGSHASIDAVGQMKKKYGVKPEDIDKIESGGSFKMLDTHEEKRPRSMMAAQYSLPFITALAFYRNLADPSSWDEAVLDDPQVVALAQRVDLHIDDELEKIRQETNDYAGIKMKVTLKNGQEHFVQVRYSKGTLENPATSEDIHEKFQVLAAHALSPTAVKKVAGLVDKLEELDDVARLGAALMGKKKEA